MKKYYLITLILIILDQGTKYFFQERVEITSFFSITPITNTGVAFGLFQGYNIFFIFISLLAILLIWKYFKEYKLAQALLYAGILGNFLDRIILGHVQDFISIATWPVFNLADSYNTIAVILLFYIFYKEEKSYKQKARSES